jgi:plasmid stabilization system protein ParE
VTLRLRIAAGATREIERIDAWWRENREAAPGAVREDLEAAFQLLLQQPGMGKVHELERQIGTLSDGELAAFRRWFTDFAIGWTIGSRTIRASWDA